MVVLRHLLMASCCFIRSSGPVSFGYSELENNNQQASILSSADFAAQTTPGIDRTNTSLKTELMVNKKYF
jgi:hypothetical protein